MAGWSSLPSDLLWRITDGLLAANDIDCYIDMRAVCHSWRSAIPKPSPLGEEDDELRFRPRQWIMLDENSKEDGDRRRLFLNVSTGRFVRRHVPLLRDHVVVAASDGLLVVMGKKSPRATSVLDPFTGSVLGFAQTIRRNDKVLAALTGPAPTMVFHYAYSYKVCFDLEADDTTVYFVAGPKWATPRPVEFRHHSYNRDMFHLQTILVHAGHVYMVDQDGYIFRIPHPEDVYKSIWSPPRRCPSELVIKCAVDFQCDNGIFLMESAGELLLIRRRPEDVKVYRVNVGRGVLELVKSIGGRALFIGHRRCLSVDADKFPSVDRNCVYHTVTCLKSGENDWGATYRYDLGRNGKKEDITWDQLAGSHKPAPRPHGIVQVLLDYCKDVLQGED